MRKKPSGPCLRINDVEVRFATRDVRNISGAERWQLERMIEEERAMIGVDREVTALLVETDYLGPGTRAVFSIRGRMTMPAQE